MRGQYRLFFGILLTVLVFAACSQKMRGDYARSYSDAPQAASAETNPMITLALNTHSGSYPKLREQIIKHKSLSAGDVQMEELLNYFPAANTDTPLKRLGNSPFRAHLEVAPCLWNPKNALLLVTLEAIPTYRTQGANLVALVDISKSMQEDGKLDMVKDSLLMLAKNLRSQDKLTILTLSEKPKVILPATPGSRQTAIDEAIRSIKGEKTVYDLTPLDEAYKLAQASYISNGVNRILLFSDGRSPNEKFNQHTLAAAAGFGRNTGVALNVLAMPGSDEYSLRAIADKGDGTYHYIDTVMEAVKVFKESVGVTSEPAAKDIKAQIEFNPALVATYTPIGYQRRALSNENFSDENVDSDDIPAGKRFSMMFELELVNTNLAVRKLRYARQSNATRVTNPKGNPKLDLKQELAFMEIQWKDPHSGDAKQVETPIQGNLLNRKFRDASPSFRFYSAVAAFGLKITHRLRTDLSWEAIADIVTKTKGDDPGSFRQELADLCKKAATL